MWRIDMIVFSFTIAVLVYLFMIVSGHPHSSYFGYLPRVNHVTELRDASRDDAMIITLTRDGKIFFQKDQVLEVELPNLIRDSLNRGSKPKLYFRVDARLKTGAFLNTFDAIRPTGIRYIAILAEQRRSSLPE
jgi:biopolymer transport protein ExbD/biopolymer transport protein TolR